MYFDSFSDFLNMGDHGLYVWLAYGIFVTVFAFNVGMAFWTRKDRVRRAKRALARDQLSSRQPSI